MCGIVGLLTSGEGDWHQAAASALGALAHRGPDALVIREWRLGETRLVLGHTRLRVIDLSDEADQPLANGDKSHWVAYNGEIYNQPELRADLAAAGHVFHTSTDTEVLAHLFEGEADPAPRLERLRGMFAFAALDPRARRVLLARDRLGIKPLWWAPLPGGFAFASEARALVRLGAVSGDPDPNVIRDYLVWGVCPAGRSVFSGVSEVPPGSYLLWRDGDVSSKRWWRPEVEPQPSLEPDAEALMSAALSDSVTRHLVADRPVGVFLSSGVDSAAVATLAARHAGAAVHTLTVTFPEGGDEAEGAARVATAIGARHDQVPVTGGDVVHSLPEIFAAMDQPTSDGVNSWLVCRAARQVGLVVALSGLGGDELFGGYATFRTVPQVVRATQLLRIMPGGARRTLAGVAARHSPGGRLTRTLVAPPGDRGAYLAVRGLLGASDLGWKPDALPVNTQARTAADRVLLLELGRYLPDQLLRDTDTMSMSHSLEVRVPLLDDNVVRLALALPARTRNQPGKALLARAARVTGFAPKRPFTLPFDRWLRAELVPTLREGLLSEDLPFSSEVPAVLRHRLWDRWQSGRVHWSRPWAVAVVRLWPAANNLAW